MCRCVDVMGLSNFFSEMGFPVVQPTLIFTGNYGVTRILEGHMGLGSVNKHVELKFLKSKDWKNEGKLCGNSVGCIFDPSFLARVPADRDASIAMLRIDDCLFSELFYS